MRTASGASAGLPQEEYRKVLKFSLEWLYSGIGSMDGKADGDPEVAQVVNFMFGLDAKRKAQLAEYARFLAEQEKREKSK
jgi:hypothetical protein